MGTSSSLARECVFSPCRNYRYTLWRELPSAAIDDLFDQNSKRIPSPYAQFIGLNPSTADETNDDPTIRRCAGFAKSCGFNAFCMTNLFAFRATDPREMKRASDPIGPVNNHWLMAVAKEAGIVIAAWGKNGSFMGRADAVMKMLPELHYLRLNDDGSPEYPLYIPAITKPRRYTDCL